jgi:hypothetical protein
MKASEFFTLKGKVLKSITFEDDKVRITTNDGTYELWHDQECCERVWLDEVNMSKTDSLFNCEVTLAEDDSTIVTQPGDDCRTHKTYFRLETVKGGLVELHWLGQTDSVYELGVQCWRVDDEEEEEEDEDLI